MARRPNSLVLVHPSLLALAFVTVGGLLAWSCAARAGVAAVPAPRVEAAQVGRVEGKVFDADGAAIGFVDVFLEREGSNDSLEVLTSEDGRFVFDRVPMGVHRMYAYATGMVSDKLVGIVVKPSSTSRFDIHLRPAQRAEEVVVNVTGRAGVFDDPTPTGIGSAATPAEPDASVGCGTGGAIGYRLAGGQGNPVEGGAGFDIPTAAIERFKLVTTNCVAVSYVRTCPRAERTRSASAARRAGDPGDFPRRSLLRRSPR